MSSFFPILSFLLSRPSRRRLPFPLWLVKLSFHSSNLFFRVWTEYTLPLSTVPVLFFFFLTDPNLIPRLMSVLVFFDIARTATEWIYAYANRFSFFIIIRFLFFRNEAIFFRKMHKIPWFCFPAILFSPLVPSEFFHRARGNKSSFFRWFFPPSPLPGLV